MGFIIWHYLGRCALLVLFPLYAVAFIAPRNGFTNALGAIAGLILLVLGLTGAVLAVRLLIRGFRFACPTCKGRKTDLGFSPKREMWLYCPQCGLFKESGFLNLKITHEATEPATTEEADRGE